MDSLVNNFKISDYNKSNLGDIRCIAHVINLVAQDFLLGLGVEYNLDELIGKLTYSIPIYLVLIYLTYI